MGRRSRSPSPGPGGIVLLLLAATARAHVFPPDCSSTGSGLSVALLRGDGKTGLIGNVSQCESLWYVVTLSSMKGACGFSGGRLELTTPDGVVHVIRDAVPCVGGVATGAGSANASRGPCDRSEAVLRSEPIAYAARPGDARDGVLTAVARYEGGVAHDAEPDSPGIRAVAVRRAEIHLCDDGDACTTDLCAAARRGPEGCAHIPLRCDDGDPLTGDACVDGTCLFAPIGCAGTPLCGTVPDALCPPPVTRVDGATP